MIRCLYKVVVQCIVYSFFFLCSLQAMPDTMELSAQLRQELQQLRQQDSLEKWLYTRIDYVSAKPFERIGFLMGSQQAAWRSYKTYDERLAWFNLLILQGYYQLQTGNILSSINAYEAALQFYEAYPLPEADGDFIEYVLKPLGNNYTRLADYNTALFIHRKTLALAERRKAPDEIAAAYSNMAICARWQGDTAKALQYTNAGIGIVDKRTALYGLLLSTYADVLTEQGWHHSAREVVERSLRQLQGFKKDTNALYWYSSTLQMAARIAIKQKDNKAALQYAQEALALFNRYYPAARQREKAKVNVLLGEVALNTGKLPAALQYYQQALHWLLPSWKPVDDVTVPPANLLYSENTLADALTGKGEVLRQMGRREAALEQYMTVFMAAKKLRAAFFYTSSKLQELQLTKKRAGAAMELVFELYEQKKEPRYKEQLLLIAELSKAQVLADERAIRAGDGNHASPADSVTGKIKRLQDAVIYYQHELVADTDNKNIRGLLEAAEYELSLLNKKIKQERGTDPSSENMLTISSLRAMYQRIPKDVRVLEFFDGSSQSYLLEVDADGVHALLSYKRDNLELTDWTTLFMQHWFDNGPSAMINNPGQFGEASHNLYNYIFPGYQWAAGKRYLLIPDGAFSYLPFDALLTDRPAGSDYRNWPWLCKKAPLSQAYSLQTWYQQQTAVYPSGSFTGFFVSKGKGQQQPVLSVVQEYGSLKSMLKGNYYVDTAATCESFNRYAADAQVLHISSHAVSSAQDSFPYLQLYDAPYYLFDLRYRSFSPSLVVLGACKTADGTWLAGEGVNSLSRGFTGAGAGGVVSGLWNVNDEAARAILQHFYRYLQQGDNAAMALHKAKLQWLEQQTDNTTFQLPYYWAGLVYSGHLQQVSLPANNNKGYYITSGVVLCIVILWIVLRNRKRPLRK
jgi:tetratricopeptide (TPR) repeat protein